MTTADDPSGSNSFLWAEKLTCIATSHRADRTGIQTERLAPMNGVVAATTSTIRLACPSSSRWAPSLAAPMVRGVSRSRVS